MVVIDSDVVQMSRGEWEIEMNVTDDTELVPYIKGLQNCCSLTGREGRIDGRTAGV